jgi:hypothetical protein
MFHQPYGISSSPVPLRVCCSQVRGWGQPSAVPMPICHLLAASPLRRCFRESSVGPRYRLQSSFPLGGWSLVSITAGRRSSFSAQRYGGGGPRGGGQPRNDGASAFVKLANGPTVIDGIALDDRRVVSPSIRPFVYTQSAGHRNRDDGRRHHREAGHVTKRKKNGDAHYLRGDAPMGDLAGRRVIVRLESRSTVRVNVMTTARCWVPQPQQPAAASAGRSRVTVTEAGMVTDVER